MSMEEFVDRFFVARDVRQKAFELLRHRAAHIQDWEAQPPPDGPMTGRHRWRLCPRSPQGSFL